MIFLFFIMIFPATAVRRSAAMSFDTVSSIYVCEENTFGPASGFSSFLSDANTNPQEQQGGGSSTVELGDLRVPLSDGFMTPSEEICFSPALAVTGEPEPEKQSNDESQTTAGGPPLPVVSMPLDFGRGVQQGGASSSRGPWFDGVFRPPPSVQQQSVQPSPEDDANSPTKTVIVPVRKRTQDIVQYMRRSKRAKKIALIVVILALGASVWYQATHQMAAANPNHGRVVETATHAPSSADHDVAGKPGVRRGMHNFFRWLSVGGVFGLRMFGKTNFANHTGAHTAEFSS